MTSRSMLDHPSTCRSCGGRLPESASFCPTCGRSVDPRTPAPAGRPQPIEMRFVTAVKIGIGIALGAAIVSALSVVLWTAVLGAAFSQVRLQ